jgi:hypothetical protein
MVSWSLLTFPLFSSSFFDVVDIFVIFFFIVQDLIWLLVLWVLARFRHLAAVPATYHRNKDAIPAKSDRYCCRVRSSDNEAFKIELLPELSLLYSGQSFPTPMEEPRKVLKAQYIGSLQVRRPSGMETLNDAIDQMASQVPADQWRDVNVAVAPSVVTITDAEVIMIPAPFLS